MKVIPTPIEGHNIREARNFVVENSLIEIEKLLDTRMLESADELGSFGVIFVNIIDDVNIYFMARMKTPAYPHWYYEPTMIIHDIKYSHEYIYGLLKEYFPSLRFLFLPTETGWKEPD